MKLVLIRHGQTLGNLEHCYIGSRTDEELCEQGIAELRSRSYPAVQRVFASPMKRCVETAQLLYPGIRPEIIPDFRECDYGEFEGMTNTDLNGREDFQRWVDSFGTLPFPGGESRAELTERCLKAFEALKANHTEDSALIVHGTTIMTIMEAYARPAGSYYDFQVRFGEGYVLNDDGSYEKI